MEFFSLEEFVGRINQYAEKHDLGAITVSRVRELMDEKIVPRPSRPGQGRGKGRAAVYSDRAFRRAISVLKLKKAGLHRFSQIRLWFFFRYLNHIATGQPTVLDIPETSLKDDLRKEYSRIVKNNAAHITSYFRGEDSLVKKQDKAIRFTAQMPGVYEVLENNRVKPDILINKVIYAFVFGSSDEIVQTDNAWLAYTLTPNAVGAISSVNDNPILNKFDDIFPNEVSFLDWSAKVFQFMQTRTKQACKSSPIQLSKIRRPQIFLERKILQFVSFLYALHICPNACTKDYTGFENVFRPPTQASQER